MRRTSLLLLLLLSNSAFAQQWHASVMRVRHGLAFDAAYTLRPQWDLELGVAEQRFEGLHVAFFAGPGPLGVLPVTTFRSYTVHPIDLTVTRSWTSGQRLSPYIRVGARYVDAPNDPAPLFPPVPGPGGALPVTPGFHLENRSSAQAGAGVLVQLTPQAAVRIEAVRLLRDDGAPFDPLTRVAAGLVWSSAPSRGAAAPGPWRLSAMGVRNGFAANVAYAPRPGWEVEAAASEQSFDGPLTAVGSDGAAHSITHFYTVHPVDVFVARHLYEDARLSPYVRAGARYVTAPQMFVVTTFGTVAPPGPAVSANTEYRFHDRASAQAGAGVLLRVGGPAALRAEVTRLLRSHGTEYDPLTRWGAGLSFSF